MMALQIRQSNVSEQNRSNFVEVEVHRMPLCHPALLPADFPLVGPSRSATSRELDGGPEQLPRPEAEQILELVVLKANTARPKVVARSVLAFPITVPCTW